MNTPYYIIHKSELDDNYYKLKDALKNNWDNYIIGYSYKTNALPWVISHFNKLGAYAEVVSEEEYKLAKRIGVGTESIIYNGPIKTKETFTEAILSGAYVNIDSSREIDWLSEVSAGDYNIGIRVNFDLEKMCPGESQCAEEGGRFGFCYENGELIKALDRINAIGHKVNGLHLHVSSKSRGLNIYKACAIIACEIKEKYDLHIDFVEIGGGFFGGLPTKPQFDEYFSLVAGILKESFNVDETKLIVEPGMALIGAQVSYVSSVIDVKDTEFNRFVVTDGTRTSIDPLMTKSSYFNHFVKADDKERGHVKEQVICGYTCMEHDRLFTANDEEELMVGDKIVYDKVGAYTMCLTPLFIKYFPDVYVEDGDRLIKVREAWNVDEYMAKCILDEDINDI